MDYLALFQKVHELSAMGGTSPTTVVGNAGMLGKMATWTADAWDKIQNRPTGKWRFKRVSMTPVALTIGVNVYDLAAAPFLAALPLFKEWVLDSLVIYTAGSTDKTDLRYRDYHGWKERYKLRTFEARKPSEFTMFTATSMRLNALPELAYLVEGDYRKTKQRLALNTDIPDCPDSYHMTIVYLALMTWAQDRGSSALYDWAEQEYNREHWEMERAELEDQPHYTPPHPPIGLREGG